MRKTLAIVGLTGLIVAFQNCGNVVNFGAKDTGLNSKVLAPVEVLSEEDENVTDETPTTTETGSGTDSTGEVVQGGEETKHPGNNGGSNNGGGRQSEGENEEEGGDSGVLGLCFLDHGFKLGLIGGNKLGAQHGVGHDEPSALCMVEAACRVQGARAFDVRDWKAVGVCKDPGGNPHVTNISLANIKLMIDALLAP